MQPTQLLLKLEVYQTSGGAAAILSRTVATTGTNYGIDAEATGAGATTNNAGYFAASGATNNRAILIPSGYPAAGTNNYAIRSESAAQSYLAGNLGLGVSAPAAKLEIDGQAVIKQDVYAAAHFFDGGTSTYFKIFTKIPWDMDRAVQLRIRGYGYATNDFDVTLSWYEYLDAFYDLGGVTKFTSAVGKRTPSRIRLGIWNDAGTNRIAVEVANDGAYWTSYVVDVYRHLLPASEAVGWTTAAGAFDGSITGIVTVPQGGLVQQNSAGNVYFQGKIGIGEASPTVGLEEACPAGFTNVKAGNNQLGCVSTNVEAGGGNMTFQQAADHCFDNYGGRLMSHSEWTSAYQNYAFTNENNLIWLGDIASPTEGYLWNGPLSLSTNTFTVGAPVRCIIPR